MSARTRNLVVIAALLLLAAFLGGFIPQYRRASLLERQLEQVQARVETLERDAKLMRARELAHLIHLETAKRNYGLAQQHAESFFNHIQSMQSELQAPGLRSGLADVYGQREAVIADLSQASQTADERVRQLVERVHGLTQAGSPL